MNVLTDCKIIWLDNKDIQDEDIAINIQGYVMHSLHTFTDFASFFSFIDNCIFDARLLLFVIGDHYIDRVFQEILPLLPPHITVLVYVFYDKKYLFRWETDTRIQDIFHLDEENKIIQKLRKDLELHLIQRWSSGSCVFDDNVAQIALDQLSNENAKFMWFQLLIQVLVRMPSTIQSKDDLLQQSFLVYKDNPSMQNNIHEFNRTYQSKDAINFYTKTGFLYRLFNQACRTDDIDLLYNFRFFIRDLYEQLTELYRKQQSRSNSQKILIVYRCTVISKDELAMLLARSYEKKIIWFNTFVSASINEEVAKMYMDTSLNNNLVSVFQEIHIDNSVDMSSTPYADIHEHSEIPDECEILMSISSVFELESVQENDGHIWKMKLRMFKCDDCIRKELRMRLEEDIEQETSLLTLSSFLLMRGDFEKSIKYNTLLLKKIPQSHPDRAQVYNNIGYTYFKMGKYVDANQHLDISIHLYVNMNQHDIVDFNQKLGTAYNNKGLVLQNLGDYTDALDYIKKSLDLRRDDPTLLNEQRNLLAIKRSYNHENLGLLYTNLSEYSLALQHLQEALNIRNENLPSNHYMIAQVYNNLSRVYLLIGQTLKASEYLEQAVARQMQSLPDNHPHRATMYNTLGEVYYRQGQYALALVKFREAFDVHKAARTRSPTSEATVLSNMGSAMKAQQDFDGALNIFLHALPILRRERPRHSHVARCLNNIGFCYQGKEDNVNAILYFKQALSFCRTYLPENDEVTAITYLSLASTMSEDEYDLVMTYLQKVITIYNSIGLPHHSNVIKCHVCRGDHYSKRNDHRSTLACYQQALFHCRNSSLPPRHPIWVLVHTNSANEYYRLQVYDRALQEYQYALEHVTDELVETPQIYAAVETCRNKIEVDVNQTMTFLLDEIIKLIE